MLFSRGKKANAKQATAKEPLVAIDIGTYTVRLIAGMVTDEDNILVSYYKELPSKGMSNGGVSDLNALSSVLSELVHHYETDTNFKFTNCFIDIGGKSIESVNEIGETTVPSHVVTENDMQNALIHARSIKIDDYKHIIHVVPQAYMTDATKDNYDAEKSPYITNPLGMSAMRLSVGAHLIACDEAQENNLCTAMMSISPDIAVDRVIFKGYAAAEAVLTQSDKDLGVCLIDFGAGTVNVAIYNDGKLILSFGLSEGGDAITREIATRNGLELSVANKVKSVYGAAHPMCIDHNIAYIMVDTIYTPVNNDRAYLTLNNLASAICYKLTDIFAMITNRIDNYSRTIKEPIAFGAGFVITGGVALTTGINMLASNNLAPKDILGPRKTRVGLPRGVIGDYAELNSPACATVIGLLRIGHKILQDESLEERLDAERKRQSNAVVKAWYSLKKWVSDEL